MDEDILRRFWNFKFRSLLFFNWFHLALPLYPLNGSLQFLGDFRSPFEDKAADLSATCWRKP
jgi:hypothetical protein